MLRKKFFIFILLAVILAGGLAFWIEESGIFYDFKSFESYEAGVVHNPPSQHPPVPPLEKREETPVQFFAVGCAGAGNEGQKIMAESMAKTAAEHKPDFVLYLGDNFYGRGVGSAEDPQWQSKFESIFDIKRLPMPFYAALGNHDYHRNPQAQVEYSAKSSRWRMPARYYSFERDLASGAKIQFFAIDTMAILKGRAKQQMEWLEKELAGSKASWKIVYGHHPVYSDAFKYAGQIEKMRSTLESLFIRHKVDFYLSAHNHSMEVFKDISGVRYIVSGAGSRPRDVRWNEKTDFAHADLSFVWLRVFEHAVEIHAVDKNGQRIFSSAIEK